jgi:hypothetical protein
VRRIDPDGIAQLAHVCADVSKAEWWVALRHVHRVDHEDPSDAVGIGDAHARRDDVRVGPRPRLRVAAACTSIAAVRLREPRPHCAIALRSAQRIGWVPWHRQEKGHVAQTRRVDDDVVAEARAWTLEQTAHSASKEPLVVPLAVRVLLDVHPWVLRLEPPDDDAAVEQVAWVVDERRTSGAEEERIVGVANGDRVDRHAGDEISA